MFVDPFEVICGRYDVSTFQFLLWPRHPPQSDVQEGCGRSVSVQAEQRADDVPHEGEQSIIIYIDLALDTNDPTH